MIILIKIMPLLCALYTIPSCTNFPMLASSKGTAGCAHCPESDVDGDEIIIEIIGYLNFDRDISVPISHALDKYYENPHFLLKHLKEFIQVGLNVCSQVVGLKIKRLEIELPRRSSEFVTMSFSGTTNQTPERFYNPNLVDILDLPSYKYYRVIGGIEGNLAYSVTLVKTIDIRAKAVFKIEEFSDQQWSPIQFDKSVAKKLEQEIVQILNIQYENYFRDSFNIDISVTDYYRSHHYEELEDLNIESGLRYLVIHTIWIFRS